MQHAGAAARQAYDKERFADFLARNIWVKPPILFQLQTRAQSLQNIGLESNFSDQIKPCLILARFKQSRQCFQKIALAKIIQAAASLCSLNQVRCNHSR
jgi:hypothetical protein